MKLFNRNYDEENKFAEGIESIVVELSENFYVSGDITAFKCGPKETIDSNPLKFVIDFKPPLIVENKSMMPLTVFEVNNPGFSQDTEEIVKFSSIPPSMSDTLVQLDIRENNLNHYKF